MTCPVCGAEECVHLEFADLSLDEELFANEPQQATLFE